MRLIVDDSGIRLTDPANFKQLSVVMTGDRRSRDLNGTGISWHDETHVWIEPSVFGRLAGTEADAAWQAGFTAMLDSAARHGWTDSDGRVRAHVE